MKEKPAARRATEGKNVSVRLPRAHLNIVMGLATIDGITIGEVIRHAIMAYGEERRRCDAELPEKVEAAKRQLDAILDDTPQFAPR
jgi:hypothetical protein